MKPFAYAFVCAVALTGLYFKVEYSDWLLLIGCIGLLS